MERDIHFDPSEEVENVGELSPEFEKRLDREVLKSRSLLMVDAVMEVYSRANPKEILKKAFRWLREDPTNFPPETKL